MRFSRIIVANLLRRPARTLFTALGLALSIAAIAALTAIGWGYADSKFAYYDDRGIDLVVVRAGVAERMTSSLNAQSVARLRTLKNVERVDGGLTEMVSLGDGGLIGVPLRGVNPTGFVVESIRLVSGRKLKANDHRVLLLGSGLSQLLQKELGDWVDVEGTQFQIIGVFSGFDAIESNTAVTHLRDVQELMDRPHQVSEIYVDADPTASDPEGVRAMCQVIESLSGQNGEPLGLNAMPTRDFTSSDTETMLLLAMAWGSSIVAAILSAVAILNTVLMSVLERTAELALLRAVGWSRHRVMRMVLGETLFLWLVSTIAGTLVSMVSVLILARYPATRTIVRPELPLSAALMGAGIGFLAAMAGCIYPAAWASCVPPAKAIRHE